MSPEGSYHIYNHANGYENLFVERSDYYSFLSRITRFILPACRIFSYGLMPNHFHLVAQIRNEKLLRELWQSGHSLPKLTEKQIELKISKAFSNLFSSYTQSFNNTYERIGSLFIPSMKTSELYTENDICKAIHYSHANPVHHGFTKKMEDWPHSSYNSYLSNKPTKLEKQFVLDLFGGLERFIEYHKQPIELKSYYFD